jgi:hypothetical protein
MPFSKSTFDQSTRSISALLTINPPIVKNGTRLSSAFASRAHLLWRENLSRPSPDGANPYH